MDFLIFIAIVGIIIYAIYKYNQKADRKNLIDSPEFQDALKKAKTFKHFFEGGTQKLGGSVMVVKYNIDKPDEIDFSLEQHNFVVYFRVALELGSSSYLTWLKSGCTYDGKPITDTERIDYLNGYLKDKFGKDMDSVKALGLDPYDVVYDMEQGDNEYETILYYPFCCPCGLKGADRDIFINELKTR